MIKVKLNGFILINIAITLKYSANMNQFAESDFYVYIGFHIEFTTEYVKQLTI